MIVNEEDLLTLARTIYGEARGEPPAGRAAVAHVVMNWLRVRFRGDDTVTKVCRSRLQFSCWNLNDPNCRIIEGIRPGANQVFDQCCDTADQVMKGQLADNTGGAKHYYSVEIARPNWRSRRPRYRRPGSERICSLRMSRDSGPFAGTMSGLVPGTAR